MTLVKKNLFNVVMTLFPLWFGLVNLLVFQHLENLGLLSNSQLFYLLVISFILCVLYVLSLFITVFYGLIIKVYQSKASAISLTTVAFLIYMSSALICIMSGMVVHFDYSPFIGYGSFATVCTLLGGWMYFLSTKKG